MRTCGRCSTLKGTATKTAATRWSSILGQAVDIPCSKSFRRWKMPLDTGFGERSDRGGRAILQFWWPTPRKLKECWDGPPSAISLTSLRVRGPGWRKLRKLRDGSNRREVTYNGSWKQRAHRPSRSGLRRLRRRTEWSYRLCRLDSVGCQNKRPGHQSRDERIKNDQDAPLELHFVRVHEAFDGYLHEPPYRTEPSMPL